MDVLQWIKEDHQHLRRIVKELESTPSIPARRKLLDELQKDISRHLYLESEYLYPEISDLYSGAAGFVKSSSGTHRVIKKSLTELQQLTVQKPQAGKQVVDEKLAKLSALIEAHLVDEESQLMPKIRELIPTQDREDLGQVFIDLRDMEPAMVKASGAKRGLAYN